MGPEHVGSATGLLSYSWSYKLGSVVSALRSYCGAHGKRLTEECVVLPPPPKKSKKNLPRNGPRLLFLLLLLLLLLLVLLSTILTAASLRRLPPPPLGVDCIGGGTLARSRVSCHVNVALWHCAVSLLPLQRVIGTSGSARSASTSTPYSRCGNFTIFLLIILDQFSRMCQRHRSHPIHAV